MIDARYILIELYAVGIIIVLGIIFSPWITLGGFVALVAQGLWEVKKR